MSKTTFSCRAIATLIAAATLTCMSQAQAAPLFGIFNASTQNQFAPRYEAMPDEQDQAGQLDPRLQKQTVNYTTNEVPGTIVVDTPNTYLYFVLGGGKAIRYGIGVGREGFTWAGVKSIERKAEWPDWTPPQEMIARQPYLPRFVAGGPGNPMGARAMYLGGTVYRIHGTNAPETIGTQVSSGCIRMTNDDVADLYERVTVGTKVIVLPQAPARAAQGASSTDHAAIR